jgi:hypothetical protein
MDGPTVRTGNLRTAHMKASGVVRSASGLSISMSMCGCLPAESGDQIPETAILQEARDDLWVAGRMRCGSPL